MHELSIVMNILEVVEENARQHHAQKVIEVELNVGMLSGVEFEALEFAFEHVTKSDLMNNVRFLINKIQPMAKCTECNHEFETMHYAAKCPQCGSFRTEIIKGDELMIQSFKME